MKYAYAHVPNRTVRVSTYESEREGETFVGTIDQNGEGPNSSQGDKDNQVLFHHVEELMIKAKLFDYNQYDIITDAIADERAAA